MILILLSLVSAFAAEKQPAGYVLQNESIVFTVDEANTMKAYIAELEFELDKEKRKTALRDHIEEVKDSRLDVMKGIIDSKDSQIEDYRKLQALDRDYIEKLNKKIKNKQLENIAIFAAGVIFTGTAMIAADHINDNIRK